MSGFDLFFCRRKIQRMKRRSNVNGGLRFVVSKLGASHQPKFRQAFLMAGLLVCGVVNATSIAAESRSSATNIAQLLRLAASERVVIHSLNLEATVWWSSEVQGRVIVHDDSGAAQLELDLPCRMPEQGARLSLAGNCTVVKTSGVIKLSGVPVVEDDGLHPATEKSGSIHLEAGMYPICVAWFNRTDKYALEVYYSGPSIPKQKIPDVVLFHDQVNLATGLTNLASGLDYRYCEGLWWSLIPDLNHLPAIKTGVVANFDTGVKSRSEQVSLQFRGYIQIKKSGDYVFYTKSDDGSRLFIGEPTLRVRVMGQSTLPQPRLITDRALAAGPEDYEWAEIEGTVTSVNRLGNALEIELATGLGEVRAHVAEDSDCSFTLVPQNRIRIFGACREIIRLDGSRVPGEFFIQDWASIEQRYVAPNLWSAYPLLTVENAMTANIPEDSHPVVHLRGKIASTGAGHPEFLEDASGRIALASTNLIYPDGQILEVLGRLQNQGTNRVLSCVFPRIMGGLSNDAETLPVLTTAEQVHQLNAEELKRGYPVKLRGVVTSLMPRGAVVLQDATRGLFVSIGKPILLHVGDYCDVDGTAKPGEFSPYIAASRVELVGTSELPTPVKPTWDQLIYGSLQNQYVEFEGVIIKMEGDTVTLLTRDGPIKVRLEAQGTAIPKSDLNALVRMRGCMFVSWDSQTHRVEVGKIYLNQQWVDVIQPAPIDSFALPTKHVGDLLKFNPQAGALQSVKVCGQIIYQNDTGGFLLDEGSGLHFLYAGKPTAHVCDLVEVVGFPDLGGYSPVLRNAVVRRQGMAEFPQPQKLNADELVRDENDSTLVQVDGVLLGASRSPDGTVLEMQTGLRRFMAVLKDKTGLNESLKPGSRLQLTGVYVGQGGNRMLGRSIDSFRLLLNSGFDVRVLSRPPWWTLRRLLTVVGALAGVLVAALIWIKLLQRRVEQRTQQLEVQIRRRQQADRQREIEQERARVAQDLHDDLGAGLTRVNMLATLANNSATPNADKVGYMADLKEIARDMVTSLDEIVWSVNPRNDTLASLVGYFGAHTQHLLDLASIKCGLDVPTELPDFALDPKFRHEFLLAFKEALNNVILHSGATKVWLRVVVQEGLLTLELEDNGRGMEMGKTESGADGLANMRTRLAALGGNCRISSALTRGTTVHFEAPLNKPPHCCPV